MGTLTHLPLRAWERLSLWECPRWDSFWPPGALRPPTLAAGPWFPGHASLAAQARLLLPGTWLSGPRERHAHWLQLRAAAHFL